MKIETVSLEIKETQNELNNKFTYLKFKPIRPITETTKFEHGSEFQRKTDNLGRKPTYANILRKRSNTNIQRKLSKQNIAESNNNASNAQKLLINRPNKRDHNKSRSAASPTMKTRKTQD